VTDQELMATIKARWGAAIKEATAASSVQPAFLAALIANESDGKADATRFEPAVFERLKEVLLGSPVLTGAPGQRVAHYAPAGVKHPLTKADLSAYCAPGAADGTRDDFAVELQTLHALATSWGLTQIMGWHLVGFQSGMGVSWLATPGGNLQFATRLLAWFAEHYDLDLAAAAGDLFTCWNTGEPNGTIFDPKYVPNGLDRMAIYEALP
jgi:hypothetical protein